MSTRIFNHGETVAAVYDDRFFPILEALGEPVITRASEVEWDHAAREWVATEVNTGREIARGRNRAAVIAAEVEYLERRLGHESHRHS